MNNPPLVSILIPTYNGAAFLAETVRSVQEQTCQEFEVVIVDDGSSDNTVAMARSFAAIDTRIRVFEQANGGTQAARNTALRQARGEWIALLDQDDVWLPGKLAAQLAFLNETPRPNLLFTNYFNWDGATDWDMRYKSRKKFPEGDVSLALAYSCLFGASTVMVRRIEVESLGGFDPDLHLSGDWDLWLRLAEKGIWARGVWEPQSRYRIWSGNESKKIIPMAEQTVAVFEKALKRPLQGKVKRCYQRSLALTRSRLELAGARKLLDSQPEKVPGTVWRAWRLNPRNLRWLFRWALAAWPPALGGKFMAAPVHRKLREKF